MGKRINKRIIKRLPKRISKKIPKKIPKKINKKKYFSFFHYKKRIVQKKPYSFLENYKKNYPLSFFNKMKLRFYFYSLYSLQLIILHLECKIFYIIQILQKEKVLQNIVSMQIIK